MTSYVLLTVHLNIIV